jgi:hypothetical protein
MHWKLGKESVQLWVDGLEGTHRPGKDIWHDGSPLPLKER